MSRTRKLSLVAVLLVTASLAASACSDATTAPQASLDTAPPCEQQGSNNIVCP